MEANLAGTHVWKPLWKSCMQACMETPSEFLGVCMYGNCASLAKHACTICAKILGVHVVPGAYYRTFWHGSLFFMYADKLVFTYDTYVIRRVYLFF